MKMDASQELLLVTLAERHSRVRTISANLARLIAIFAGIAAVLLYSSHHPARAGGLGSMFPEAAGLAISIPLNGTDRAGDRPHLQIFTVVEGSAPARLDLKPRPEPRRTAFLDLATAGGLAGVAVRPTTARPGTDAPRATARTIARPVKRASRAPVAATRAAARPPRAASRARKAQRAQARRTARRATAAYQRLLRRYITGTHASAQAKAAAHGRLVEAYRIAAAWRKYASID